MKKIFVLYLSLVVLCLSLSGCSGNSTKNIDNESSSNPVAQEPQSGGRDNADMPVKNSGIENITVTGNDLTTVIPEHAQTVVYENVEMRRYEDDFAYPAHPYIHDIKTNNTNKAIVKTQTGTLAYDRDGKPIEIDWEVDINGVDEKLDYTFYYLWVLDYIDYNGEILPDETRDVFGGRSLNIYGNDPSANEIAYILYCDKEITFEDGTVWENPDFDKWLNTYEGKTIDVNVFENYYPYVQTIVF